MGVSVLVPECLVVVTLALIVVVPIVEVVAGLAAAVATTSAVLLLLLLPSEKVEELGVWLVLSRSLSLPAAAGAAASCGQEEALLPVSLSLPSPTATVTGPCQGLPYGWTQDSSPDGPQAQPQYPPVHCLVACGQAKEPCVPIGRAEILCSGGGTTTGGRGGATSGPSKLQLPRNRTEQGGQTQEGQQVAGHAPCRG